jgi:hypothetical protein
MALRHFFQELVFELMNLHKFFPSEFQSRLSDVESQGHFPVHQTAISSQPRLSASSIRAGTIVTVRIIAPSNILLGNKHDVLIHPAHVVGISKVADDVLLKFLQGFFEFLLAIQIKSGIVMMARLGNQPLQIRRALVFEFFYRSQIDS